MSRVNLWLAATSGCVLPKVVLLSAAWLAAVPASGQIVQNQALRMEFEKSPAPFVSRLVHKGSGQALVASPVDTPLFSVILAKADGPIETIGSDRAAESNIELAQTPIGQKVVIRYGKFPALDLAAEVTVACDANNPLTLWSIRVQNNTGRRLVAVRFPQLLAVSAIDASDDDCLVLPAYPGTLIENPGGNWRNGQSVTLKYPGELSSQFVAFQDRLAGLYLASMDPAGHPMAFTVARQADGFSLLARIHTRGGRPLRREDPVGKPLSGRRGCDPGHVVQLGRPLQAVGRASALVPPHAGRS